MPFDLFGEVVITEEDVFNWVAAVAPVWLTPERSFRYYVRTWNVHEKIRWAKIRGEFDERIASTYRPWHARLALGQVL